MERVLNYIGGRSEKPSTNEYIDKIDPRTNIKQKEVASSGPQDVDNAVAAAVAALPAWRGMRPSQRGRVLVEVARSVRSSVGRLGDIERAFANESTSKHE